MTATVESTTPSAVIDRVSLVLDAFDGPGRLTLAQIVRRTGLPRSSAHRMLERLVNHPEPSRQVQQGLSEKVQEHKNGQKRDEKDEPEDDAAMLSAVHSFGSNWRNRSAACSGNRALK